MTSPGSPSDRLADEPRPQVDRPSPPVPAKTPWRAAWSSALGSTLEYYDFFVNGTAAALVFNHVFFPSGNALVAAVAALATFGVGYVARPFGALVFGNLGDRLGRKRVLILTLGSMGFASLAIGCLPSYGQIGIAAPILLVLLRLVQGFSAGGESAGASALTLEHSPDRRRGFFTSFTLIGYAAGMVLSSLIFVPLATLSDEALLSWGWRIPFILGSVVLVVAYYLRRSLSETPVFREADATRQLVRFPVLEVLRSHWSDVLRVAVISLFAAAETVITVFGLAYATSPAVGVSRTTMLLATSLSMALSIPAIPLFGHLSDRIGRRPVWIVGTLGCGASTFSYFWSISTGSTTLIVLMSILNITLFTSMMNGVWAVLFAEMFPTAVRFSGFAIGTQFGFLLAGFTPAIGWAVLGAGITAWVPVAILGAACALVSAIAGATARETYRVPTAELGLRT